MELSVHDNILYAYTVVSDHDRGQSYTITLHTEFLDHPPVEYTDIVFTDVVAHHFEIELPISILFDVDETELERVYEHDQDLFARLKEYGWPCVYTTADDLLATLKTKHIKAFAISSSYGLDGWVWAKQMTKVQRDSRKQFA